MTPIARLDSLIQAAGIPIFGVASLGGGQYRVDFKPEATVQQRLDAQAIVNAFDGKGRRAKTVADIYQSIRLQTAADQSKIFAGVAALIIQKNPDLVRKLLNIAIDGDEVGP